MNIYNNSMMHAYLVEIEEELKFFVTTMAQQKVQELHEKVYTDCNILWVTSNISQFTKEFILNYLKQDEDDGFYQSLEGVDLTEFQKVIEDVNGSLVGFKSFFNGIIKEPQVNIYPTETSFDIGKKVYVSTRNGDPLEKNLGLRKVPSIWNTPSSLEEIDNLEHPVRVSTVEVQPFDEFNDLYSCVGDSSILGYASVEPVKYQCYVYYNKHFNKVVALKNKINTSIFAELQFVTNIEGNEDDIVNLQETLEKNYFFNIDQLEVFIKYYDTKDKTISEQKVKKFMNDYFEFDDSVENRIRFTVLLNKLTGFMALTEPKDLKVVKQLLPRVLKSLNLTKKRYSDGNYWFGIKTRNLYANTKKIVNAKDMEKLLEDKVNERNCCESTHVTLDDRLNHRSNTKYPKINLKNDLVITDNDDVEEILKELELPELKLPQVQEQNLGEVLMNIGETFLSNLSEGQKNQLTNLFGNLNLPPLEPKKKKTPNNLELENFLKAGYHIGVDTTKIFKLGEVNTLRNGNLQLRSEPSNPQTPVSIWKNSSIPPYSFALKPEYHEPTGSRSISRMIPPDSPAPSFEMINEDDAPLS